MKKSYECNVATPIMFYKYGGKQLYYFNTYDGQGEIEFKDDEPLALGEEDDGACESCVI